MNEDRMTATEATEAANHGKAIELFEAEYERKMDAMRDWLEPLRIQFHQAVKEMIK